jgi:prefoldin beta subunit
MEMTKETQEKIGQLQLIEQNLQGLLAQKQQFQSQMIEIDSALKEIKDAKETYKIVGNIMVSSEKESLEKDLKEKKEMMDIRINALEKQETQLKEKAQKIQKDVMSQMKED